MNADNKGIHLSHCHWVELGGMVQDLFPLNYVPCPGKEIHPQEQPLWGLTLLQSGWREGPYQKIQNYRNKIRYERIRLFKGILEIKISDKLKNLSQNSEK